MTANRMFLAAFGFLVALAPASADEGFWLYSQPPRRQLKARYGFDLTDPLLERLQKASVNFADTGSGAFVAPDGLVLTNHHVGMEWIQDLSAGGPDLLRDGFYAAQHEQELRCTGLELRVLWTVRDVTARVEAVVKPGMTLAQASKARDLVLSAIESEARMQTGLDCDVVPLDHGGRYHLYGYKKYTDVRLVFAPEAEVGALLDACFFRAYENGRPAQTPYYLPWGKKPPERGDLALASGCPGASERFCTPDDLEARYGPLSFLRFKLTSRLKNALADFAGDGPDRQRQARFETFALDVGFGHMEGALGAQEKLLDRIRARERARQHRLMKTDPRLARERQQALDVIAKGAREGAELAQAHFFLESANAFQSSLFDYARGLLRHAEEAVKPDSERLPEYRGPACTEVRRILLEAKPVVKEMEIVKLAVSLDLWAHYAGADAALVARILDGKSPEQRARALVAGSQLERVDVRKALLDGGRKTVAASPDTMLALARLVDARCRALRRQWDEQIVERSVQAYAVLARIREKSEGGMAYPDATGTLRLSYGKVLPYADTMFALRLADAFTGEEEKKLPPSWKTARGMLDGQAMLLFRCTADAVPGSSGSPVVDQSGRLVGVVAWVDSAAPQLAYREEEWGAGAVAADGILEVLDTVYHATALVQELGGNHRPPHRLALSPRLSYPVPLNSKDGTSIANAEYQCQTAYSTNPVPPLAVLLRPVPTSPVKPIITGNPGNYVPSDPVLEPSESPVGPTINVRRTPRVGAAPANVVQRHENLIPALVKAMKDSDPAVRRSAEDALTSLGNDALPALIELLRTNEIPGPAETPPAPGTSSTNDNVVARLLEGIDSTDVDVRRRAARTLASLLAGKRD